MSRTERRPQRYTRSNTTSVTQLLSDSCSSLLARLTTRSREEPSTRQRIENRYDRHRIEEMTRPRKEPNEESKTPLVLDSGASPLGTTRSRLEDKYSDVLQKYVRRKNELQRAASPTPTPQRKLSLAKSATTTNVLLSEKAYPFVSSPIMSSRDKTPFRATESRPKSHKDKDSNLTNRINEINHRRRRSRMDIADKPLKLCPKDFEPEMPLMSTRRVKGSFPSHSEVRDERKVKEGSPVRELARPKQSSPVDDVIKEREARRKEIQSLINKYVMLDEAYGKVGKSKTREKTLKAVATQTTTKAVATIRAAVLVPVSRIPPRVHNLNSMPSAIFICCIQGASSISVPILSPMCENSLLKWMFKSLPLAWSEKQYHPSFRAVLSIIYEKLCWLLSISSKFGV